ncbi:MAG: hypothetical protein AAF492_10685, partial [Verrucomicrobiota bacterium]
TNLLPVVSNQPATDIGADVATVHAQVDGLGNGFTAELFWGPDDGGADASAWSNRVVIGVLDQSGAVHLESILTGLAAESTNYFTFRLSKNVQTVWATPSESFLTAPAGTPVVLNGGVETETGLIEAGWELRSGGPAGIRIYWGRSDGGTNPLVWDHVVDRGTRSNGSGFAALGPFLIGETVFYRAFATNTTAADWAGETMSFKIGERLGSVVDSNLLFWLDAEGSGFTFTSNDFVDVWMDRSSHANHATRHPLAGATSMRRTANAINGRATVEFVDGQSNDFLELLFPVEFDTSDGAPGGAAFVVAKTTDSSGGDTLMSSTNSQGFFRQGGSQSRFVNGTFPTPRATGDSLTADRIRYADFDYSRTPRIQYLVNGVAVNVNNDDNLNPGGFSLTTVGGAPDSGCCGDWLGDIAEILIWDRVLSDEEQQQVGLYLSLKYGLASTYSEPAELTLVSDPPVFVFDTTAGVQAHVTAEASLADVRLVYGTDPEAWEYEVSLGSHPGTSTSLFHTITGLTDGVTYYYAFHVTNCAEEVWSATRSFTTVLEPVVDHGIGAVGGFGEATLHAELLTGHVANLVFFYGGNDGGTNLNGWNHAIDLGPVSNGVHTVVLSNLVACTSSLYYRAYASNAFGGAWAPTTTVFQPLSAAPGLEVQPVADLSPLSATLNARLTITGSATRAWVYFGAADGGTDPLAWDNGIDLGGSTHEALLAWSVPGFTTNTTVFYAFRASNCAADVWTSSSSVSAPTYS